MKNKLKIILCSVLCAAMIVPVLASCANNEDDEPKVTQNRPTNSEDPDDVPEFIEADYDKEDFKFLWYGPEGDYSDAYIWSDGISGGAIGDAVAERNLLVEERYNVTVSAEECGPMGEAVKRMQAGQVDYDVIYEWGSRCVNTALDGMLYDFLDLPNINLEASYWVPGAVDDLTVCDNMFIATNYITMNSFSWGQMLYFNKNLMDKLNYEYPYTYVENNTWLIDDYLVMITDAEEDINGDGDMTLEDQYGAFTSDHASVLYYLPMVQDNGDGTFTAIGYTEKLVALFNEYEAKLEKTSNIGYYDVWDEVDQSIADTPHMAVRFAVFGEDHSLFLGGTIDMTKELVNMKSDYGVCPYPKLDPKDEYRTSIDINAPMFALPVTMDDPEMTGAILEYMAYESEQNLLPAYYDTTIKTKRMQDTRDYDMLDIIRTGASYNGILIYMGGIEDNGFDYREKMLSSGNFASVWARYGKKVQASLDTLVEKMNDINY